MSAEHHHAPAEFNRAFAIGIALNTPTALLFMKGREHDLNIRGAFLHDRLEIQHVTLQMVRAPFGQPCERAAPA